MSRVQGFYTPVNPDRVNPEFIGIGQKFSQHKRNRMKSDKHRKTITSNFIFTQKLNQDLQKTLIEKQKQLRKLQSIRDRHYGDIEQKKQEHQKKQKQLFELKLKSKQQRDTMKNGIKRARQQLKSDRRAQKNAVKNILQQKNEQFKAVYQQFQNYKNMKHRSVELSKKIGSQKINQYYREKNLESYNNYMKKIKQQDQKSEQNLKSIEKMNSQMKKLEKKIKKKQDKLKQVLDEINLYTGECSNPRKTKFLATTSVFRPHSTSSSWRSRPSQILRSSINHSKNYQQTI